MGFHESTVISGFPPRRWPPVVHWGWRVHAPPRCAVPFARLLGHSAVADPTGMLGWDRDVLGLENSNWKKNRGDSTHQSHQLGNYVYNKRIYIWPLGSMLYIYMAPKFDVLRLTIGIFSTAYLQCIQVLVTLILMATSWGTCPRWEPWGKNSEETQQVQQLINTC